MAFPPSPGCRWLGSSRTCARTSSINCENKETRGGEIIILPRYSCTEHCAKQASPSLGRLAWLLRFGEAGINPFTSSLQPSHEEACRESLNFHSHSQVYGRTVAADHSSGPSSIHGVPTAKSRAHSPERRSPSFKSRQPGFLPAITARPHPASVGGNNPKQTLARQSWCNDISEVRGHLPSDPSHFCGQLLHIL